MNLISRFFSLISAPLRLILRLPMGFSTASQRLLVMSLPARVALLVALFLVICVVTAFVAFYQTENRASWDYWVNPVRVTVIVVLLVIIPLVVYQVLRLWLTGGGSRFPDIDEAWRAGVTELHRAGLELSQVPIFLIVGSSGEAQEKAIFTSSRLDLRTRDFPQGPAALHWYANPDGIYLVLTTTSCLGKLASLGRAVLSEERAHAAPLRPRLAGDAVRGTVVVGGQSPLPAVSAVLPGATSFPSSAPHAGDVRGTMMVGASLGDRPHAAERKLVTLTPTDANEQQARLRYVCDLLRRARRPLCPANGVLAWLPFELMARGPREAIEVERCVKRDLDALRAGLMLRCPATAMVVGMDEEAGFRELVRRVGRERVLSQRFGKGFSLGNPPLRERLTAVCIHACGAFEDWIYALFAERGSLSKPGNTKLYALLCNTRRNVQSRLAKIIANGFGFDPEVEADCEPMLFGGCYFTATGETEDRQAFIKGVFDKLPDQQEEVEWTGAALREDARYQALALFGYVIDTLLLAGLIGMIVYRWFWPHS